MHNELYTTEYDVEKKFIDVIKMNWYKYNNLSSYKELLENFRNKLKSHRKHIMDFDVIYLNAETGHGSFTKQGTVRENDLTGNYQTAFNKGKIAETEDRAKHTGVSI